MQEHKVSLIGVPSDVGAGVRGASMGPEALRVANLGAVLASHGVDVVDLDELLAFSRVYERLLPVGNQSN